MADRLISADALKSRVLQGQFKIGQDGTWYVLGLIDSAPTIEAEPIKHGRWEVVYYDNIPTLAYCNRCDQVLQLTRETEKLPNYCPNCGAKMDEVEE